MQYWEMQDGMAGGELVELARLEQQIMAQRLTYGLESSEVQDLCASAGILCNKLGAQCNMTGLCSNDQ